MDKGKSKCLLLLELGYKNSFLDMMTKKKYLKTCVKGVFEIAQNIIMINLWR